MVCIIDPLCGESKYPLSALMAIVVEKSWMGFGHQDCYIKYDNLVSNLVS